MSLIVKNAYGHDAMAKNGKDVQYDKVNLKTVKSNLLEKLGKPIGTKRSSICVFII